MVLLYFNAILSQHWKWKPCWGAYVSGLPGYVATGEIRDEVFSLISDAIHFQAEDLWHWGDEIPKPSSESEINTASKPIEKIVSIV